MYMFLRVPCNHVRRQRHCFACCPLVGANPQTVGAQRVQPFVVLYDEVNLSCPGVVGCGEWLWHGLVDAWVA